MNAKIFTREQISALADGEVAESQIDATLAALKTPDGREAWTAYHEIGDVLKSDDMDISMKADFASRVMARLDSEPTVVAPAAVLHGRGQLGYIGPDVSKVGSSGSKRFALSGIAAAAVAALAFVTVPQILVSMKEPVTGNLSVAVDAGAVDNSGEILRNADVDQYLIAHKRFSPSVYSTAQYARSATFAVDSDK